MLLAIYACSALVTALNIFLILRQSIRMRRAARSVEYLKGQMAHMEQRIRSLEGRLAAREKVRRKIPTQGPGLATGHLRLVRESVRKTPT